ncbi:transcriptional repressor p66-alpha [Anopheles nili]|uniref:transcriptional repressor p66-alpha n=1 Tax=Anopheles nili TaxID=185578 RepID=UPI00237B97A7|nr:transcriptional repressor p66-alpha [Anopheles nili]
MERMEVDDSAVVDLSLGPGRSSLTITPATARDLRALAKNSGLTITPALPPVPAPSAASPGSHHGGSGSGAGLLSAPMAAAAATVSGMGVEGGNTSPVPGRRVLRPRTEVKSYAEVPDIVLLPAKVNGRSQNGSGGGGGGPNSVGTGLSESEDEEMPPVYPIKELTAAEICERERGLRKLREELRSEETKLVLLKKLKQSQQVMMKENLIVTPGNPNLANPLAAIPAALTKGSLSVTPTNAVPLPAHSKSSTAKPISNPVNNRGSPLNITPVPKVSLSQRPSLPGGATLTPSNPGQRLPIGLSRSVSNLIITPSVTITPTNAPTAAMKQRNAQNLGQLSSSVSITPTPPIPAQISCTTVEPISLKRDRDPPTREDPQSQAQRQASAKLALRKQLEKTLLQIPPPKPPPPEMHFVPNPSNIEFVYLLGLEHVVDYLTKDKKQNPPQQPYRCAQCKIDFTPVWKWEKQGKRGNPTFQNSPVGKDPKVICEQCVTSNVKKALKAEHTNRLKTAFVKALQQEQEIEARLAAQSSPSPVEIHPTPSSTPGLREERALRELEQAQQQAQAQQVALQQLQQQQQQQAAAAAAAAAAQQERQERQQRQKEQQEQLRQQQAQLQQQQLQQLQQQQQQQLQQQLQQQQLQQLQEQQQQQQSRHHHLHQLHAAHLQSQVPSKSKTPTPTPRPTPTPPNQHQTPPPASSSRSNRHSATANATAEAAAAQLSALAGLGGLGQLGALGNFGSLGNLANLSNSTAAAAAVQALHQQLFRGLQQNLQAAGNLGNINNLQAQMMQFSPLLYSYQLAMAQAAASLSAAGKGSSLADMQRALELQRQYQEMLSQSNPGPSSSRQNNWKS